MGEGRSWTSFLPDILIQAAAIGAAYYAISKALSQLQSGDEREQLEQRQVEAAALQRLDRLDRGHGNGQEDGEDNDARKRPRWRMEDLKLNRYEQMIAMDVIAPDDIPVTFSDIGGLENIVEELKESVIYPLTMPEIYSHSSALLTAPSGVLLYGPPGCGKTMLAKALAHESGATFINLHIASVTEKWFGDSNKLVTAVFTLARKLQPSIVFIDEIDAVLGRRRTLDHEASGQVKAEFMTHWDGLTSGSTEGNPQGIMILGATNRIEHIDEAILRRMPKKIPIPLPSATQRERIFDLVLEGIRREEEAFDLGYLVKVSAGMSGSDIREACRDAAMIPMREFLKKKPPGPMNTSEIRGLKTSDFFETVGGIQIEREPLNGLESTSRAEYTEGSPHEKGDIHE